MEQLHPDTTRHEENRFCLGCRYPLHGLNRYGNCPECGRWYHFEDPYSYATSALPPSRWHVYTWEGVKWVVVLLLVIAARLIVASAVQVEHAVLLILYPMMHLPACLLAAMNLRLVQWTDRLGVITAACAVIGALSLLAVPGAPLSPLMGLATGAIAGTALRTLQIAGWID